MSIKKWEINYLKIEITPPRLSYFLYEKPHRGLPVGFLCYGIQFSLLLSPNFCFISFLYVDLYVLGDSALIT